MATKMKKVLISGNIDSLCSLVIMLRDITSDMLEITEMMKECYPIFGDFEEGDSHLRIEIKEANIYQNCICGCGQGCGLTFQVSLKIMLRLAEHENIFLVADTCKHKSKLNIVEQRNGYALYKVNK